MALNFFSGYLAKGSGSASFVEINYPGYSRQKVDFGPMSMGLAVNLAVVSFTATQPWLPVTQTALFDSAGNPFLWWNATSVTLGAGQSHVINPGDIALYFDAAAVSPSASLQSASGAQAGIKPGGIVVTALAAVQIANGVLSMPANNLSLASLPTTLPASAGVPWNNGGVISIS